MGITESLVPGVVPGLGRPEFRVEGDHPWASYTTREAAEKREAELAAEAARISIPLDEV